MDFKIYWLLTKFIVPLGLTTFITDVAEQFLNRGLSSAENATEMLATFGIAYSLIKFAGGPFEEFKNVALVLVHNKKEAKIGLITLLLLWAVVLVFALLTAYTDFGYFITHTLYSLDEKVGQAIRKAVLMLSIFPLFQGLIWYLSGYILQLKYTTLVGTASVVDIAVQIGTIFGLLQTDLVNTKPVLVPIIAVYAGSCTRFCILLIGFLIMRKLKTSKNEPQRQETNLSILQVLKFWWPLAMVRGVQTISRTIINLFVARDLNGSEEAIQAIAVLTIIYPIGRLPYSWLNDLKYLQPTFLKALAVLSLVYPIGTFPFNWLNDLRAVQPTFLKKDKRTYVRRKHIRNFDIACLLFGFAISCTLFWIPGIVTSFYTSSLGISEEVANMCVIPLKIFSFFPLLVGSRAHCTSWLLLMKKTMAVFPSAVMRLVILIAVLNIYPKLGLHGAPLGVAALLSGFAVETLAVNVAAFVVEFKIKRNGAVVLSTDSNENVPSDIDKQETSSFVNRDKFQQTNELDDGKEEESVEMVKLTTS